MNVFVINLASGLDRQPAPKSPRARPMTVTRRPLILCLIPRLLPSDRVGGGDVWGIEEEGVCLVGRAGLRTDGQQDDLPLAPPAPPPPLSCAAHDIGPTHPQGQFVASC